MFLFLLLITIITSNRAELKSARQLESENFESFFNINEFKRKPRILSNNFDTIFVHNNSILNNIEDFQNFATIFKKIRSRNPIVILVRDDEYHETNEADFEEFINKNEVINDLWLMKYNSSGKFSFLILISSVFFFLLIFCLFNFDFKTDVCI